MVKGRSNVWSFRLGILLLSALILGMTGILTLPPRQPQWQGKPLTEWLDDLTARNLPQPVTVTPSMLAARQEAAVVAVREMGTNALPWLVEFLSADPSPSRIRQILESTLQKQSIIKVQFPAIPDRRGQAIEAFRILGPTGEPAIPRLSHLLESGKFQCLECLVAIGPASIPVLIHALSNTNANVPQMAIQTLGEFGTASREAVPQIEAFARGPNESLAAGAMQVLSEIDPNPSRLVPLFETRLHETNLVFAAAFSLGRVGPDGIGPLVRALAADEVPVRIAAAAALAPEIRGTRRERYPTNYSLRGVWCLYNSRTLSAALTRYQRRDESSVVVPAVAGVFTEAAPAVRVEILELCARYGAAGAPGLAHGMIDESAQVRQRANGLARELGLEIREGAVVRGPVREKNLCLVFTGYEFGEGGMAILNSLEGHNAKASFFLTGDFLTNANFVPLVQRIVQGGHYLGPHSDKHLLYCDWSAEKKTRVTRGEFIADLINNQGKIEALGEPSSQEKFFVPPYEHYSLEIADWAKLLGYTLVSFSTGTRSTADYTTNEDIKFVSSQAILDSIISKDTEDPNGLNGFVLLLHLGSGPQRSDKFSARFGELLDYLKARGYSLVRVDELLEREHTRPN